MDEMDFRLEARLHALEYLLCSHYAQHLRAQPDLIATQKQRHKEVLDRFDQFTVPGVDAVQSDVAAAELRDAVERLLDMMLEMAEAQ